MMHSIIAAFDAAIAANQGKLSGFPGTYNTRHIIFEFEIGQSEQSGSGKSIYSAVRSETHDAFDYRCSSLRIVAGRV